jgi:hypothetical protein
MHELDAANGRGCRTEVFHSQHGTQPGLQIAMVLLDQIQRVR